MAQGEITLSNARIVLDGGVREGWLSLRDGRVAAHGEGAAPAPGAHDLGGRWVLPGLVDVHCHGGAGGSFPGADPEAAVAARRLHLEHGTTTLVASLVTAAPDTLLREVAVLAELADDGVVDGIHLEGPYLSAARCGAHEPSLLRDPDIDELLALVKAARGHIRMITVAPELPGALEFVRVATDHGVTVAVGHTEAGYDQARAAFDAGARVATHLFNAMRPLHHREPGPIGAALTDDRVTVELINDGVHVHSAVQRLALKAAGTARTAFVTDAMAAAGLGDGAYRLGSLDVEVRDGVAVLAEGGAIAGSTIVLHEALRRAVDELGLALPEAVRSVAPTPAAAVGLADRAGSLEAGRPADLVVLDDDLALRAVMRRGSWIIAP
ncbi:N-acetylglucosamine-6-phosphate deacetylase [Allonocardiopsis opalescens]|uniref:N-acetylglucosamine-6-phosphate deacetylase n=1 Tax=Allonocardiopsis opalescens TaxID=1144618 RepID=UPI000D06ECA6|nr:N-acetylglucosamine-6-phosphate deacetylase [Allonocardiopsis opalescens]